MKGLCKALKDDGYDVTYEYPGYLSLLVRGWDYHFGFAEGYFGFDAGPADDPGERKVAGDFSGLGNMEPDKVTIAALQIAIELVLTQCPPIEEIDWKQKYLDLKKQLEGELFDPNGTIWEVAKKQQEEIKELKEEIRNLKLCSGPVEEVLPEPDDYTVWCRQLNNEGTTYIDQVLARSHKDAALQAVENCARDWQTDARDIGVIGITKGSANILHWTDLNEYPDILEQEGWRTKEAEL